MISKTAKKALALIIFLSLLLPSFSCPFMTSHAEESDEENSTPSIYSRKIDTKLFSVGKFIADSLTQDNIETYSADFDIVSEPFENTGGVKISPKTDDAPLSLTVFKRHEEPLDLTRFKELSLYLLYEPDSISTLNVTVTLKTYSGNYSVSGEVGTGDNYELFIPLTGCEDLEYVYETELTFLSTSSLSSLKFSSLYGDTNFSYEHIKRFSADKFSSETGLEKNEKEILLDVSNGFADVKASDSEGVIAHSNTAIALVSVSGAQSGTMTLRVKDSTERTERDISTLSLTSGKNSYPFIFPSSNGIVSYELVFSAVTQEGDEKLTLHSVGITNCQEKFVRESEAAASISSCTLSVDMSEVRISGTLLSSTAAGHIDAALGIIAEDIWGNSTTGVLTEGDMTTIFSFSVSTNTLPMNPAFYKFFVVLIDGDEIIPISDAAFTAVASANVTSGTDVFGLQSNINYLAFVANASHTVVDVRLDKLEGNSGAGSRLHSYEGEYRYINNAYVKELDNEINFSLKAGIPVYLRILDFENPDGEKNSSEAYSFNASSFSQSMRYMSLVDFISARYEGVAGYIVGTKTDSRHFNYCDKNSIISYARNYASILRMTSVVVRNNVTDAFVSVPVGDGGKYVTDEETSRDLTFNEITGIGAYSYDPLVFSAVLSKAISDLGSFGWYLMYESDSDPVGALDKEYGLYSSLLHGSGSYPSGHILFWSPDALPEKEYMELTARKISEMCAAYNTKAFILSLKNISSDDTDIILDTVGPFATEENSNGQIVKKDASLLISKRLYDPLLLWDFRKSFSTEGFISAGGVASLTTDSSPALASVENTANCRALHGTIEAESGKDGIILCFAQVPIDPSKIDLIDLSMYINNAGEHFVPVTVIFGTDNSRYEFSANVPTMTNILVGCDTTSIEKGEMIKYIAVTFTCKEKASFDISSIAASCKDKTPDELAEILGITTDENTGKTDAASAIFIICTVIFSTILIFTALSVRTENHKGKKEALQTKKK